ncbi:MAG TPA: LacI family DNA-binding transcriptional regulator [Bryobacteraceae bacterium]|nr:LacI family DNA-binding transcriptional regulator [Bryobacteraceae bacterium]
MAVRMKDIARDLGVSTVTVSKAIRNHSDISPKTRRRVLQRIKELNYQPNLAARTLVTGRTYAIGLIVPDLVHPFFGQVAKSLARVLRERDYGLVISSSEEDPALERDEIERLLARRVDALIVASAQRTIESFRRIGEEGVPYILIDRYFDGLPAHFVGVQDEEVGDLATQHLIDVGCRRIAHIRGPEISPALGRMEGYRRALARNRRVTPPSYVVTARSSDDAGDNRGYDAMQQLLELKPLPDGVFCYNDPIAFGALRATLERGLRVPEDIAVVGCGNVLNAAFLRVPLTSIDQDSVGIGERAAELALGIIEAKKPSAKPKSILLHPTLVARDSTRRS